MAATEYHPTLLLFIMLLCHLCSTQTLNCHVTIQIDCSHSSKYTGVDISSSGDSDQLYRFSDLEVALDMVANGSLQFHAGNNTLCIDLTPGEHVLGYSQRVITHDLVISGGNPQEVTVMCTNQGHVLESGYKRFPLRFGNESTVIVRGVGFVGCARPLLFDEVWNVTLEDCWFSLFTQSAVELYNTPFVTVTNCSFTNNTSFGVGTIRNSGNAGALSIGFNETFPNTTQPQIRIQDSTFDSNVANISSTCMDNAVLSSKVYTQRGGALAGYFAAVGLEVNLVVERCVFEGNRAQDSGGGVYINLSGVNGAYANMTFRKSNFSRNFATIDGGGIEVTFDSTESVHSPNFLLVQDCHFTRNRATYGGAIKPVQISSQGNLNQVRVERSTFQENRAQVGAVMHLESFFAGLGTAVHVDQNPDRIVIEDCTFSENTGKRSVVFINYNQVNFTGSNNFTRNTGSVIRVAGTLLSFSGRLLFAGNRNHDEGPSGTLYVTSFAQVLLNPGVSVSFINNTGREGAAIVVKSSRISSGFARTLYNPQCFLQFTSPQVPPIKWVNYSVSLEFVGNTALFAPVLYISSLDACSWFNNSGQFFNINITETWSFMSAMQNYVMQGSEPIDRPELYIQTEMKDLRIDGPFPSARCEGKENSTDVCAYPGQDIRLNVTALDQFAHTTSGFLQITTKQGTDIQFSPTIVQASVVEDGIDFQYNASDTFRPINVTLNSSFSVTEVASTFTLRHIDCPPGFRLSEERYQCECEERVEVLACDPAMEFVLLDDGLWGAPPNWSRLLVTYPCPATYCNCSGSPRENSTEGCALNFTDPTLSCNPFRKGILCGECRQSYGVGMLAMQCREFKAGFPMYYWLLPLLVLFVTVVVVVVVKVGVPIPILLFGFLFYIQISPVAVRHLDDSFMLFPDIMGCIESALALYVPYDFSLRPQLTALESYGLRYITPLLTLVTAPIAMRIKYHPRSWHGVWTLLLLMYGMAVNTSASLLFCPTLTRSNNGTSESITVWFFDGNVRCYSGTHLALTILAVLFLVIGVLFVLVIAILVYQKEISKKISFLDRRHFETISLVLTSPYKDTHQWWAPFELARRYIFLTAVIFSPGNLTVVLSIAGVILTIQWFVQPYKDYKANLAEGVCLAVLVTLLSIGDSNDFVTLATGISNFTLWPVFYLPVVVGFVCLCAVLGREIWKASKSIKAWWENRTMQKDLSTSIKRSSTVTVTSNPYKTMTTVVSMLDESTDL